MALERRRKGRLALTTQRDHPGTPTPRVNSASAAHERSILHHPQAGVTSQTHPAKDKSEAPCDEPWTIIPSSTQAVLVLPLPALAVSPMKPGRKRPEKPSNVHSESSMSELSRLIGLNAAGAVAEWAPHLTARQCPSYFRARHISPSAPRERRRAAI